MPFHYNIEEDVAFVAGEQRGEQRGISKQQYDTVVLMLQEGKLAIEDIARYTKTTVSYVKDIQKKLADNNNAA